MLLMLLKLIMDHIKSSVESATYLLDWLRDATLFHKHQWTSIQHVPHVGT